jgi:hypothetical protein
VPRSVAASRLGHDSQDSVTARLQYRSDTIRTQCKIYVASTLDLRSYRHTTVFRNGIVFFLVFSLIFSRNWKRFPS